jgi:hypothetical protein
MACRLVHLGRAQDAPYGTRPINLHQNIPNSGTHRGRPHMIHSGTQRPRGVEEREREVVGAFGVAVIAESSWTAKTSEACSSPLRATTMPVSTHDNDNDNNNTAGHAAAATERLVGGRKDGDGNGVMKESGPSLKKGRMGRAEAQRLVVS